MTRTIDKTGRIFISQKWLEHCREAITVISIENGGIVFRPYNPQKHDLSRLLYRKVDDRGRVKIPSDIVKALRLCCEERYHLYIGPDNTALLRPMGDYCDICGLDTQTEMVLGRNICTSCLNILKRSE